MSRKLDMAIAETLGKQIYTWSKITDTGMRWGNSLLRYSGDGNAMLELDREMQARGYVLYLTNDDKGWGAKYEKPEHYSNWFYIPREGLSEPLARALAAYKALTGEEWEEEEVKR